MSKQTTYSLLAPLSDGCHRSMGSGRGILKRGEMMATLSSVTSPGKFEGELLVTEWAHSLSLAGCDEECGDVSETGWYGLLRGPFRSTGTMVDVTPAEISELGLTTDDLEFLANTAGVILSEDSQGFVSGEWYDTTESLEAAWYDVEQSFDCETT